MAANNKTRTKLLIFEGMDNTGKTTTIKQFGQLLEAVGYTYKVIKADNPIPKGTDIVSRDQIETLTTTYYDMFLSDIISYSNKYDVIILDRSWISEYVYGQIYRNRTEFDCIKQIYYIENKIRNIFDANVYIITFISDNINALKYHEDGKSLSSLEKSKVKKEYDLFTDIMSYTTIEHKWLYDPFISDSNNFKKILPLIISTYNKIFLNKSKTF